MKQIVHPMRAALFLAAFVAFGSEGRAASLPDPIAPAAKGQLQCYTPDMARKTCNSIAAYQTEPNGTIDNIAIVLLLKSPVVTMETVSPVDIKSGEVCGTIRKQDVDAAKFKVDGRELDSQQADPLRQQLQIAYKDIFDHEICTAYVPDGGAFIAKAKMAGTPTALPDQRVIWVSPDEGYTVAP